LLPAGLDFQLPLLNGGLADFEIFPGLLHGLARFGDPPLGFLLAGGQTVEFALVLGQLLVAFLNYQQLTNGLKYGLLFHGR
jgi:hypothetical protein